MDNTADREKVQVELNGVPFYYETAGKGHPVVWVHAGIADSRMWDAQFELFRHGYEVVRYDQRGYGKTPKGQGDFSYVQDLKALLDFLGLKKVVLVGCSMGGRAIIDFALENPDRVAGLVHVCRGVSGYEPKTEITPAMQARWKEYDEAEEAGDIAKLADLAVRVWIDGPRGLDEVDPAVREKVRDMATIAAVNDLLPGKEIPTERPAVDRLGEIKVPVLVLVGELDNAHTQITADKLVSDVPTARKLVITQTNHLPNLEKPEEFNREVMLFLGSLGNYGD